MTKAKKAKSTAGIKTEDPAAKPTLTYHDLLKRLVVLNNARDQKERELTAVHGALCEIKHLLEIFEDDEDDENGT